MEVKDRESARKEVISRLIAEAQSIGQRMLASFSSNNYKINMAITVLICVICISNSLDLYNFYRFHLYKENKDTQEALGLIGKMLGVQVFPIFFLR